MVTVPTKLPFKNKNFKNPKIPLYFKSNYPGQLGLIFDIGRQGSSISHIGLILYWVLLTMS